MNIKRLFRISGSILLGLTIILIWFLFGPPILTRAASYTVCPAGPPTCDYNSIQSAVDAADNGDVIRVAAGTYTGINNKGGLAQVVYIDKSITIRGGYTTSNWTTSDPVANPTTLDAQGGGRVLYITGNISPTIEGLRITGGEADGLGSPIGIDAGGGILIITATATIKNNQVFSNAANSSHNGDGGGIYLYQSEAMLDGNTFNSNTAQRLGGGLYLFESGATLSSNIISDNNAVYGGGLNLENSDATLDGNTISSNTAFGTGGVWLDNSAATLINNTIISNTATPDSGGTVNLWQCDNAILKGNTISHNIGGGVWSMEGDDITIRDNTISDNYHEPWGGGLLLSGNGIMVTGNTITFNTASAGGGGLSLDGDNELIGNNISNNNAVGESGGGLWVNGDNVTISGNIFSGNSAYAGGAIHLGGGNPILTNNIIVDNHADNTGSAILITGGVPFSGMLHNTIARNSGGDGSGIHIDESTITLTNNIIADHTVGIYVHFDASASLEATLWGDGAWANGTDWAGTGSISTTNDLWGNPDFVDPDAGDYHIGPYSDAIDQGVDAGVTTDIDFHPRPYQAPDIGADEYWPPGELKFIYLPVITR